MTDNRPSHQPLFRNHGGVYTERVPPLTPLQVIVTAIVLVVASAAATAVFVWAIASAGP